MSFVTVAALLFSFIAPYALGAPTLDSATRMQNGATAQQLNLQFASLKKTDPCEGSDMACVEGSFAQCVSGQWALTVCPGDTKCFALPLVNKAGTSISCDRQADAEARISNAGVSGGLTGTRSTGSSFHAADDDQDCDGGKDSSGATNGTKKSHDRIAGDGAKSPSAGNQTSPDCDEATTTVTVTVTGGAAASATISASKSLLASATLAPGFTLPSPGDGDATASSSGALATALPSSAAGSYNGSEANGTTTSTGGVNATSPSDAPSAAGQPPLNDTNATPSSVLTADATLTLSPASASAVLASLSAANPGLSVITLSDSDSPAPSPVSISLFTTTPAAAASATQSAASLAAAAPPASAGYPYRMRRGF